MSIENKILLATDLDDTLGTTLKNTFPDFPRHFFPACDRLRREFGEVLNIVPNTNRPEFYAQIAGSLMHSKLLITESGGVIIAADGTFTSIHPAFHYYVRAERPKVMAIVDEEIHALGLDGVVAEQPTATVTACFYPFDDKVEMKKLIDKVDRQVRRARLATDVEVKGDKRLDIAPKNLRKERGLEHLRQNSWELAVRAFGEAPQHIMTIDDSYSTIGLYEQLVAYRRDPKGIVLTMGNSDTNLIKFVKGHGGFHSQKTYVDGVIDSVSQALNSLGVIKRSGIWQINYSSI